MYKAISKQMDLDERQQLQLKKNLEESSWLYSESTFKRALACYGYVLGVHLIITLPLLIVSLGMTAAR